MDYNIKNTQKQCLLKSLGLCQKNREKNNIYVMLNLKNFNFVPSIVLAFSTCLFFYLSLAFNTLITLVFLLFVCILLILIRHIVPQKSFALILFIVLGFFISNIAHIRLNILEMPILSLAQTKKIEKITIVLDEDVKPAGHKYYKARGRIFKCKYQDGSIYSCKGRITTIFPSRIIKENYMGNCAVSRHNEVSIFCQGIQIEVSGSFSKDNRFKRNTSKTFFVYEKSPIRFLGWKNKVLLYRTHLRFLINRMLYGWKKAGSLLLALLTANKDFISLEDSLSFRKAGLSHVLALSGMHLAIIGFLSTYFASFLLNKKSLKLLLIIASFTFLFFAGASPSLIRAFFMLTIIAIAKLLYVEVNLLGVLCFTFTIHLVFFPEDSLTLSFMLSYGALFGILVCSNAIYYFLNSFLPDILNESISASLGATFFTTPIIAFTIKQISFICIISTCIISPLISIFLMLGIIFIFISLIFPQLYEILGYILNLFHAVIIYIVYFFANFPVLVIENYIFSFIPLILAIFVIVFYKIKQKEDSQKLIF
ncbi:MAG: ComEC/Rec2 family competence protein [Treponema sp.]